MRRLTFLRRWGDPHGSLTNRLTIKCVYCGQDAIGAGMQGPVCGIHASAPSETVLVCKICHDEGRGFIRPVYEEFEDGTAVQRCPECQTVMMFYSNQGSLDLSSLPPADTDDFEIFSP